MLASFLKYLGLPVQSDGQKIDSILEERLSLGGSFQGSIIWLTRIVLDRTLRGALSSDA
jgi:hypothetical protein